MAQGFSDRKVLIKQGDGASPEVFTTLAALRDVTITETAASVETTTKDDNGYRALLDGRTLHSTTITGNGLFTDNATIATFRTAFRTGSLVNFQIDIVDTDATTAGEILTGAFQITQFELTAPNQSTVDYTVTLESSGQLVSS